MRTAKYFLLTILITVLFCVPAHSQSTDGNYTKELLKKYSHREATLNYTPFLKDTTPVSIKITGQFTSSGTLINDTVRSLETFGASREKGMFKAISSEILKQEEGKNIYKISFEKEKPGEVTLYRWKLTYNDGSKKPYIIIYTPTPDIGGTDITIFEDGEFKEGAQKLIINIK